MRRNLIDILDLSVEEIDELCAKAEDIYHNPEKYTDVCHGKIMGALFFEPSTRTRLSFTSAMMSLGGNVLGFSSAASSSVSKGETVSDTVRMVSAYSDIIAMRHPKEGAPIVAKMSSRVPIINAGDGGHYHPTQTLTDLMTIRRRHGRFDGLTIGVLGDLKYGRTVHSLIGAMSRYKNIKFVFISPDELKVPQHILNLYKEKISYIETENLEDVIGDLDILYMTRIQKERFSDLLQYERLKDSYELTREKLKNAKANMSVMHPLPRVTEINTDVDDDPRAAYFEEAECGRYIRMALILKLLADKTSDMPLEGETVTGKICGNPRCITSCERGIKHLIHNGRCIYCDRKID